MKTGFHAIVLAGAFWGSCLMLNGQVRPLIWTTPADRESIFHKIESQSWARAAFEAMQDRVHESVARHEADPITFLRRLPVVPHPANPDGHPTVTPIIRKFTGEQPPQSVILQHHASLAIDCGVLYYLTGDEKYARCASDILNVLVEALIQLQPEADQPKGGLFIPQDLLYEARVLGAQIPLIYDFVQPYLITGVPIQSLSAAGPAPFNFSHAQSLFRLYARLVLDRGLIDNNHPVLEMPCLAHNLLALDDPSERSHLLEQLVSQDTPHQDSLAKVIAVHRNAGSVWPEPFGYSAAVSSFVTYMVTLVQRQTPELVPLAESRPIALALARLAELRYPNGDSLRIGDSSRRYRDGYWAFEIAYRLGQITGDPELQTIYGGLINQGIADGRYDRSVSRGYDVGSSPYFEPIKLLWFAPEISGLQDQIPVPTTDELAFAGVVLQRNLSPDHDPDHGLMAVVNGGHYVHAHASGMALELFGAGTVLGANAGPGVYQTDEHENYRRLFAAYNSVIVNGASRSAGGWNNLGINRVETIAMEPLVHRPPVSPRHSFTLSRFVDEQTGGTSASQERLVGIIRTSATSGFYVDVFRSRSTEAGPFHDYVYHNIGETLTLATDEGKLAMVASPDRFRPVAGSVWQQNESYLFPGWHFFQEIQTSAATTTAVTAGFSVSRLEPSPGRMTLHFPGGPVREYATALAPATKGAPDGYADKPTPVLIVRQPGEAWDHPFAAIFEPSSAATASNKIQSVTNLPSSGPFAGFTVRSIVDGQEVTHHVIVQPHTDSVYENAELGIGIHGRYGVITLNEGGACTSLYLGEGSQLRIGNYALGFPEGVISSANADLNGATATVTAATPANLVLPDGRQFHSSPSPSDSL